MKAFSSLMAACLLFAGSWQCVSAASVHDPSVIKNGNTWYLFGSHLAAAKSTDLVNWNVFADGVNQSNPLFNNVTQDLAEALAWAETNTLWAADVIQLGDGKFYMYYNACRGDSPLSALGVAVANNIEGPYVNKQILLRSGKGQTPTGANYNASIHPNVVDPHVFFDKNNRLWMTYGSYSGGIFILELDPITGLIKPGQTQNNGFGKHLIGGNHSRIEAPYILYSPHTNYYYLFTSFGGLAANGGYDIRVARSSNPDGPYVDANGNAMSSVIANCGLDCGDPSIQGFAQKMVGGHLFDRKTGDTGSGIGTGYVSPGHNSAYYNAATSQYFLFFHSRFPNQGEAHEIRVHEFFMNEDGWPVAAPLAYRPRTGSATVTNDDTIGTFRLINLGKNITAGYAHAQSSNIALTADGLVSGSVSGSWFHRGNNRISIQLNGHPYDYEGVLSRQWHQPSNKFVITFSAQSRNGVSIWGIRPDITPPLTNGTYRITPSHSNKALDVAACGSGNGTNVQQWSWLNNDCQKWNLTWLGEGYYRISPVNASSKALDIENIATTNGANAFLWDYWGGVGQQFRLQSAGSNRWRIVPRHSEKCLDVINGDTADGANVIQWSCIANQQNQQFIFQKL